MILARTISAYNNDSSSTIASLECWAKEPIFPLWADYMEVPTQLEARADSRLDFTWRQHKPSILCFPAWEKIT